MAVERIEALIVYLISETDKVTSIPFQRGMLYFIGSIIEYSVSNHGRPVFLCITSHRLALVQGKFFIYQFTFTKFLVK